MSWEHVQVFLSRLNEQESENIPNGWRYVLPTEAEWEYSCRAGSTSIYSWGGASNSANANCVESGFGRAIRVGSYDPNAWGFLDMHGNVHEWTADWNAEYTSAPQTDPEGPQSGTHRIMRGGAWNSPVAHLTSFRRFPNLPSFKSGAVGFRLAFKKITNPPENLDPFTSLTIEENQRVGTVVGEFNATDPDGDDLTYHLVSGAGDTDNSLFTLDTNGTLKSATIFDYETNASTYSIRVQAKDEFNATVEGNFTVTLTDDIYEDTDGDGFSDAEEIAAGTNPNDANSKPGLDFGLVAWYPFDGNASDMSGNGNHGAVNGATLGTDRHGVAGKAYSFDGVDDYIESTGDFVCPKYSIGAWLRSQSDGQRNIITIKQVDSHYNTYLALEHLGSSHRFRYLHRNPPGNSGGIDAYSTNSLNDGFWYYINAIHDGSVNALL